jgi:predicted transcriptional regulator
MRTELIEQAIFATTNLKSGKIDTLNKEGILTDSGEVLTKEEVEQVKLIRKKRRTSNKYY